MMLLAVAMTILIAEGHPTGTVLLSTPMVIVAAAGHLFAIPRYGMEGAAWVTAGTAILAAMIGAAWAVRAGHALIPWGTIARSVGLALMAFALGRWWPAPGIHLLVKLAVVSGLITLGYWMLRELSRYEIGVLKDVMSERILGAPAAGSTLGRTSVR